MKLLFIKKWYQYLISVFLIALMLFIIYRHDLEILFNEAIRTEAFSHVLLIPFLAGFLFYMKKDMVMGSLALDEMRKKRKKRYLDVAIGVSFCLIAFLLYWYGSYTFYPLEYHLFSLPIFIMGIIVILLNLKSLVVLFFPVLFLLFLIPPPTEYMYNAGSVLSNFNTQASYTLLSVIGLPVTLSHTYGPPIIELQTAAGQNVSFTVDLACSGVYTLIAFTMFAAFLALISSTSFLKKLGIFIFGVFVFIFLNIIRITTIVLIGYQFGEAAAMTVFHTVGGLILILIGIFLILVIAEKVFKIKLLPRSSKQTTCQECEKNLKTRENFCSNCGKFQGFLNRKLSRVFWIKLLATLICSCIVVFSINAPTFAIAKETIHLTSGWENIEQSTILPETIQTNYNYTLVFGSRDTEFEKRAGQDCSLIYIYTSEQPISPLFVFVDVSSSFSNLHSWEVCLATYLTAYGKPPSVSVVESSDIQLDDAPIIARYFVFKDEQGTYLRKDSFQATLYWYEKINFNTGFTVEQKYVRISLIIRAANSTVYNSQKVQIKDELLFIGQYIATYLEPIKRQALLSLGITAQQILLIMLIVFIAFTEIIKHIDDVRRRSVNLKTFRRTASKQEKQLLTTILNLNPTRKIIETQEIRAAFGEEQPTSSTKKSQSERTFNLDKTLQNFEDALFIKRDIISSRNKPKLIWRVQI